MVVVWLGLQKYHAMFTSGTVTLPAVVKCGRRSVVANGRIAKTARSLDTGTELGPSNVPINSESKTGRLRVGTKVI